VTTKSEHKKVCDIEKGGIILREKIRVCLRSASSSDAAAAFGIKKTKFFIFPQQKGKKKAALSVFVKARS